MRFILQFIWAGSGYLSADMDFMEVHSYKMSGESIFGSGCRKCWKQKSKSCKHFKKLDTALKDKFNVL